MSNQIRVEGVPFFHELKCWPEPFAAVRAGEKTYEIRKDDRDFRVGDCLTLREWDPQTESYSDRELIATIRYKTAGGEWGLPSDLCVLSLGNIQEDGRMLDGRTWDEMPKVMEVVHAS